MLGGASVGECGWWFLGRTYEQTGAIENAIAAHEREEESGPTPYFSATIHAALGDVQSALDALRIPYRARLPHLVFAAVDPALDDLRSDLRSDRRFRELLLRMG